MSDQSENKNQTLDPALEKQISDIIHNIPLVKTLQIRLDSLAPGECRMSLTRDGTLDGIYVSLHGGIMMAPADSAACVAIQTQIGVDDTRTPTDMNIRYLAPALNEVKATATVIKAGRTLCPTEIKLHDETGKLLAVAQVTYMRLQKKIDRGFEK